jgi:hypothetical protein
MPCEEMRKLEEAQRLHREAELFLTCGQATSRTTAAITLRLLLKECQVDQARTGRAMRVHRRDCADCASPISNWIV